MLGTSSGSLLVYSIAKGNLEYKIHSGTSQCVSCVSWSEGNLTYAGAEQLILCFDLETRSIKRYVVLLLCNMLQSVILCRSFKVL